MAKKLKVGDQCPGCSGTGMQCQCCGSAIGTSALDDCECWPNVEPVTCEVCSGKGALDEMGADMQNDSKEPRP